MNLIGRICPVTDAEAARMVRSETIADLADQIMAEQIVPEQVRPGWSARELRRQRRSRRQRRRPATAWRLPLIALPAAAAAVAAFLIITSSGGPSQDEGPAGVGAHNAQVLSFTRHGGYLYVIVRNPVADAKKYRAEFTAHHLNITLRLLPASPSLVGTLVSESESAGSSGLAPITAKGKCFTGGGGNVCPVGVKVPVGYKGQASLYFGRAARSGERYETTAPATAPGEVMHGMHIAGKTVAPVLGMLARRHITVPVYHYTTPTGTGKLLRPGQVPRTWHVYDADPWAPRQVMLWVGPARTPPKAQPPQPATPAPSASPGKG